MPLPPLFRVVVICRSMCNFVACPLTLTKSRSLVALTLRSVPNSSQRPALPSLHFCVSPRVRLVAMRRHKAFTLRPVVFSELTSRHTSRSSSRVSSSAARASSSSRRLSVSARSPSRRHSAKSASCTTAPKSSSMKCNAHESEALEFLRTVSLRTQWSLLHHLYCAPFPTHANYFQR